MSQKTAAEVYFSDGVLDAGFLQLPHLLNRHYRRLDISEEQLVFILQIMAMQWDITRPPEDLKDIATRMQKSMTTVRGYSHKLRVAGLLEVRPRYRQGAQIGNHYNLAPLWARLRVLEAPVFAAPEVEITIGPAFATRPVSGERVETPAHPRASSGGEPHLDSPALAQAKTRGEPPAETPALAHAETPALAHPETDGLKGKQEKQEEQEAAAAAATLFSQIIALSDATELIAKYPTSIANPVALVEEATKPSIRDPAAMLVYLIRTGWSPAPGRREHGAAALASSDDPLRWIRTADGRCTICGGDFEQCGGEHLPPWMREAGSDPPTP